MIFLRQLKSDFKRAILSRNFLFATLGVTVLVVLNASMSTVGNRGIVDAISTTVDNNGFDFFIKCVLPLLPFSLSFAMEWKEHSYLFYISRVGSTRYILSKVIISGLSGFLVILIGVLLAIPIFSMLYPELPICNFQGDMYFYVLFEEGHPFWGCFVVAFHTALAGVLTAVCALWFSLYLPNPLAVIAAPFVIDYTLVWSIGFSLVLVGAFALGSPFRFLDPVYWIDSIYHNHSPIITIGARMITNISLCLLMGFSATRKIKRRVLNG